MIQTSSGLPNSCSNCGQEIVGGVWNAANEDAARAGAGLCDLCVAPSEARVEAEALGLSGAEAATAVIVEPEPETDSPTETTQEDEAPPVEQEPTPAPEEALVVEAPVEEREVGLRPTVDTPQRKRGKR